MFQKQHGGKEPKRLQHLMRKEFLESNDKRFFNITGWKISKMFLSLVWRLRYFLKDASLLRIKWEKSMLSQSLSFTWKERKSNVNLHDRENHLWYTFCGFWGISPTLQTSYHPKENQRSTTVNPTSYQNQRTENISPKAGIIPETGFKNQEVQRVYR